MDARALRVHTSPLKALLLALYRAPPCRRLLVLRLGRNQHLKKKKNIMCNPTEADAQTKESLLK